MRENGLKTLALIERSGRLRNHNVMVFE